MAPEQISDRLESLALHELREGDADFQAAEQAVDDAGQAENEAAWALVSTMPATRAGASAFAHYVAGETFEVALQGYRDDDGTKINAALLDAFAAILSRDLPA